MADHAPIREDDGSNSMPALLFHYQPFNAEFLKTTIVGSRIFASDPKSFNDPWDCAPNVSHELLDDEQTLHRYFRRMYDLVRPNCKDDEEAAKRANFFLKTPEKRRELAQLATDSLVNSHKMTRVFCLSERYESALMWGHYGRCHTGVCLGFRAASSTVFNRAVPVEYASRYPRIDPYGQEPEELARAILAVKSEDWAYEREYRLLVSEAGDTEGVLPCINGLVSFPESDLAVVIGGCCMSNEAFDAVRGLARQRPTPVQLFRATKARDEFKLSFHEVVDATMSPSAI